jgi:hypothetical protein
MADGRKRARRSAPANKLSEEERARILALVNSPEFASQPPSQIVPTLSIVANSWRRNRLSIGSRRLCVKKLSEISGRSFTGSLVTGIGLKNPELTALLKAKNGFFAFESALRVFSVRGSSAVTQRGSSTCSSSTC